MPMNAAQITSAQSIELDEYSNQMIPLVSEVLNTVRYDKETQSLDVTFRHGKSYTLEGVPPDIFLGLVHAASPGRYFNDHLKGKY